MCWSTGVSCWCVLSPWKLNSCANEIISFIAYPRTHFIWFLSMWKQHKCQIWNFFFGSFTGCHVSSQQGSCLLIPGIHFQPRYCWTMMAARTTNLWTDCRKSRKHSKQLIIITVCPWGCQWHGICIGHCAHSLQFLFLCRSFQIRNWHRVGSLLQFSFLLFSKTHRE